MRVIILGNDAQLAARPAVPVQLFRACLSYGYAFVAPASWGDELLAERITRCLENATAGSCLILHCPLVASTMGSKVPSSLPTCASVSPPVATARYLRAAFAPGEPHITYVGLCPEGTNPEINEQISPDALLARLTSAGCAPLKEPLHFSNVLPPDRRRFASNPGGAPAAAYLAATVPDTTMRDVALETLATVAKYCLPNERCLLDLAQAAGCHCAADGHAMQRQEPPRSSGQVVNPELIVDLEMTALVAPPSPASSTLAESPERKDPLPSDLNSADSNPAHLADTSSEPNDTIRDAGAVRGTPPKDITRLSSAVAMGGSVVSLLLAPAVAPPTACTDLPPPSLTTRVRIPEAPAIVRVADRVSPPEPVRRGKLSAQIEQDESATGSLRRRPVQLWSSTAAVDETDRLTRRLPARAPSTLVTGRPPDATKHTPPESTPITPQT